MNIDLFTIRNPIPPRVAAAKAALAKGKYSYTVTVMKDAPRKFIAIITANVPDPDHEPMARAEATSLLDAAGI